MNNIERKLFSTDDWLARNPKVIAALMIVGYLIVSYIQQSRLMNDEKSILNPNFKYIHSSKTNVAKTFERIRKQQAKDKAVQVVSTVRPFCNVITKKFK